VVSPAAVKATAARSDFTGVILPDARKTEAKTR
jgi:hypothetical protein